MPRPCEHVTVGELGEDALIDTFAPLLPAGDRTLIGPGDDCAVLTAPDRRYCVSTDVLVEGHHFRLEWSSAEDIGARAAAQNLADVAAMGARPVALVVSLVLPATTTLGWVHGLVRGLARGCAPCGAGVVGGDLSAGEQVVVAVTAHGDLEGRRPVLRSGARPGDIVVHAGNLGRSAAGLALLSAGVVEPHTAEDADGASPQDAASCFISLFRAPEPPLEAGPALARAGASAMMDVSDSLLRDCGRMARASGVVIDLEEPTAPGACLGADMRALAPVATLLVGSSNTEEALGMARDWVLTGGEDHGMLAAVPAGAVAAVPAARVIGRVREAAPGEGAGVLVGGREPTDLGWDHFARRS